MDAKILTKSNPPKDLNHDNLLKEVFAERRIRNAGAFGFNSNINSLASNMDFRKMGVHQLASKTPFKNEQSLNDNVRAMLNDYEHSKASINIYPDTLSYGILAKGYLYAFAFEINEDMMPQRFNLKLKGSPTMPDETNKDEKWFPLNYEPGPLATGMKKMVDF